MLGSSFRFIYLFIYLFTTWHFLHQMETWKKTSPRLKIPFIYLFIYLFILFYLFISFFLMYKRVMKCIMVGANRKDRFDLFACSGSLRSWRFVWREGKWTVQISEAVSASCSSSLLRFSFARLRNKTASPATQAIAVAVAESTMTFVHCNFTVTYRHFQITLRKSYLRLSWFAVLYNWSLSKPLTM